ncbi:MAG: hypothetical protein EZS28_016413 [Streblomastix strix]|uniref:Uncharacterized protein n=1 Tax=Streblomastix strix TaxID=222440 RepID=A0A5J4W0M3_9EUKA|nr:MAG: hypothetical protein EZS28_016413 [Streblomastix strix]
MAVIIAYQNQTLEIILNGAQSRMQKDDAQEEDDDLSIGQSDRILRDIALTWRNQDSSHILEVLRHKTTFKGDQDAHSSLSKIIQQELEDDAITHVQDSFVKCRNPIFAIQKKNGGWRKILDCRILNIESQIEVAKEMRPYLCFNFNGLSYSYKGMPIEDSTAS